MSAVLQKQDSSNTIVFLEWSRLVVNYHPVLLQSSVIIMPPESLALPKLALLRKILQRLSLQFVKQEMGNIIRYRIAGNFWGRKFSWISRFESHPQKFSPRNFGHAAPTYVWFQAIRESFLREILTSYGSAKVFSLESLPLYGISTWCCMCLCVDNAYVYL